LALSRTTEPAPISGTCAPSLAAVRDAFAANFAERGEVGGAVCVIVRGEVAVDLVGGWADADRTREWQPDTLVDVYSVGKALVALLLLQQVDAGVISLDEPIAAMWPEFGAEGKGGATVRHALCHRAGVPAIRERLTDADLADWDRMAGALAATAAWFEPGSRHVYHTNTYGHLIGELVHRTCGVLPGERLREVAASVDADVWCGLPAAEQARCADVVGVLTGAAPEGFGGGGADEQLLSLSYFNPPGYSSFGVVNSAHWRSVQVPSTNTHATAAGIARMYDALLDPGRLVSPALLAEATRAQSTGYCPVLDDDVTFGLGFTPTTLRRPLGPNPRSFGHFGTGGALGFADPDAGVAFGYVMNDVIPRWQSTRNRSLVDAVYASL
jgi:CubicO group peptidase (beta-lactamase class C family)